LCGIGAGAIAAGSVTPADVVKTRLQVKSEGGLKYKGIVDCFSRILKGNFFIDLQNKINKNKI